MSILASLKNTLDEVRVQVYPRNETEKKVYDALSSKNWGASSTLLNEIANDSHDYEKFTIISNIVWAALETEGKTWKQVFKALTLIDFLVKNGAERFIESCRDRLFKIRALQDYNYYEGTIDKGSGIREKAKQLVELLNSNEHIRDEREKARALRNKFQGIDSRSSAYGGSGFGGGGGSSGYGNSGIGSDSYGRSGSYGGNSNSNDNYNRSGASGRYSDSYSSESQPRRGSESGGRYGGGSYDSDRPNRYTDESHNDHSTRQDEFEERAPKPASSSQPQSASKSSAGKIKVNIKKAATPQKVEEPEIDLMGGFDGDNNDFDPFSAAPAPAPAVAAAFDPFGPAPTHHAPAPANNSVFDPFAATPMAVPAPATHAPAPAAAFDPFAAPAMMPAAAPSNNMFGAPQAFPAQAMGGYPPQNVGFPPQTPGYPMTQAAPVMTPMGGAHMMQANAFGAPAPSPAPQTTMPAPYRPVVPPSAPTANAHADADFGDFATAPSTSAAPAAADKWGDLGKLVDLGKIEKNDDLKAKQVQQQSNNQVYANNSFAGLDGFSKAPQSMASGGAYPRPMGSMGGPMGAPMGGQGMPRPMGAPMGQPMGAPMGQPMAGGGMGFGGAPAPVQMGFGAPGGPGMGPGMGMGAPMGQPMGGQMGGMPMGMGAAPPQNYGMYYQNQPGFGGGYPQQGFPPGSNVPPRGFH